MTGGQQIRQRCSQVTAVAGVERADDSLGNLLDTIVDVHFGKLVQQEIVQRFRSRLGVGHQVMTTIGVFLDPVGRPFERLVKRVGQLGNHILQTFEILLVVVLVVDDQFFFIFAASVFGWEFVFGFVRSQRIDIQLLEQRILIHLLFDAFLQRKGRQLQNLHRLDHPRCQLLSLQLSGLKAHRHPHDKFS